MAQVKEFRSPSKDPVKVFSEDFFHSALIEQTGTRIREELWTDAYSKGCLSSDMAGKGYSVEQTLAAIKQEELNFEEQVLNAIKQLVEEGDPEKLDATGKPTIDAIGDVVGRKPTAPVRNALYKKVIK